MSIVARNLQDRPVLSPSELAAVYRTVQAALAAPDGDVGLAFVGDGAMSAYHRQFMDDPSTTDVLSFPGEGSDDGYWGDIIVCTDQAVRQADALRHPYPLELLVLVVHGLLHLRGYDHTCDDGSMRRLERELRPRCAAAGGLP